MALTAKQAAFVAEFQIDLNATKAAIRAGSKAKRASQAGHEFLTNPDVRAAIDEALSQRMQRVQVDADYVLKRLFEMAEADRGDLYDDDGRLLPVKEWPDVWRKGMVSGIETQEMPEGMGVVRKFKSESALAILQTLGKHIKVEAFQEQVAVTGIDALADRMERATRRLAMMELPLTE